MDEYKEGFGLDGGGVGGLVAEVVDLDAVSELQEIMFEARP